ncbi:MAG: hypothetical protein MJ252_24275 [archaeon]|nr:hypothetical protein [archaeon]
MSDTNSIVTDSIDNSFFLDHQNFVRNNSKQKDVTKGSSNAEKVYES